MDNKTSMIPDSNEAHLKGHKILTELKEEGTRLLAWSQGIIGKKRDNPHALGCPKLAINDSVKESMLLAPDRKEAAKKLEKLQKVEENSKEINTDKVHGIDMNDPKCRILNKPMVASLDVLTPQCHASCGPSYPLDINVCDLKDHSNYITTLNNDHYREVLIALQQKYGVILRKFEEINEQRMSYIEGIQELQAHLDNSRSIIQLQRHEVLQLKTKSDELEKMQERHLRELQSLRINLRESNNRENTLRSNLNDLRNYMEGLNLKLSEAELQINELERRLRESVYLPLLPNAHDTSELNSERYTFEDAIIQFKLFIEMLRDSALDTMTREDLDKWQLSSCDALKALKHLDSLYKLDLTNLASQAVFDRIEATHILVKKMNAEFDAQRESDASTNKQLVESLAVRVHQANAECFQLKNMLSRLQARLGSVGVRRNLPDRSTVISHLEKLIKPMEFGVWTKGCILQKAFFKNFYFHMDNRGTMHIGTMKNNTIFVSTKAIPLKHVLKVDFGYSSKCWLLYNSMKNMKKSLHAWNCLTIYTRGIQEYHITSDNDDHIESWVVGLNCVMAHRTFEVKHTELSSFRLTRAKMKIYNMAAAKGISQQRLWLNAIHAAAKQI